MTIYQASSGAWVFNAGTNEWSWGLDDYFTGLSTPDGANNGPRAPHPMRIPVVSSRIWLAAAIRAIEQITRNVLNKFIGRP